MLFAAGHINALGADDGVDAVWKLFDNIVALCVMECLQHLLAGGAGLRHTDIFEHRHFEKLAVLKDEGHSIHESFFRDILYVHTTDEDLTRLDIPEAGDETCYCCLAAAGGTDQSYVLAGLYVQVHSVHGLVFPTRISESNVFQRNGIVFWLCRSFRLR